METYKKLLLATMIAGLVGCGSSESTSSTDDTLIENPDDSGDSGDSGDTDEQTVSFEIYYKDDALTGTLTGSTFVAKSLISTYSTFTLDTDGNWTYDVPELEALGDMESDETVVETIDVTVDGETLTLTFTIKSADAKSDDDAEDDDSNDDGDEDEVDTYACSDAYDDDGLEDASPIVTGATHNSTVDDLNELLASGDVVAGDEIIVSGDGDISIKDTCFNSLVLIRAENIGDITLDKASISNSQNIALQGFEFGPNDESTLVKIVNSKNIKILRNKFDHSGITDGQNSIVLTESSEKISIAYNAFLDKDIISEDEDGQINSGSYIKFQYDDDTGTMTKEAHIHHNYFYNIVPYVEDGNTTPEGDSDREAIVFGDSGSQDVETNHLIEYNLFEDCDGENEIMTVKTSNNEFSNNTFLNSMGSLSFRLGHDNKAYDNYFYGTGESELVTDPNYQTGGIRVYGANHIIDGNYMTGLSGTTWRRPILIDSGDVSDSSNGNSHESPTNVTVSNNTVVDSVGGGIHIGGDNYSIQPTNITTSDNTVEGAMGNLFDNYDDDDSNSWSGNAAYATGEAVANAGGTLDSDELAILSSSIATTALTPLTSDNVGVNADL